MSAKIKRPLTKEEATFIEKIGISNLRLIAAAPCGMAQVWYDTVLHFLESRGDEVISGKLRDTEIALYERGLSQEYFDALLSVVSPDPELEPADKFVMLLTASEAERYKAVKQVIRDRYFTKDRTLDK